MEHWAVMDQKTERLDISRDPTDQSKFGIPRMLKEHPENQNITQMKYPASLQ